MDRVMPLRTVYLFGSHARGEAGADSDVDLCLVAEGAECSRCSSRTAFSQYGYRAKSRA